MDLVAEKRTALVSLQRAGTASSLIAMQLFCDTNPGLESLRVFSVVVNAPFTPNALLRWASRASVFNGVL